jgi:hypothetical protein
MFATLLGWGSTAFSFLGGIKIWLIIGGIVSAVILFLWMENSRLAAQRDKARIEAMDAKLVIKVIREDQEFSRGIIEHRNARISELEGRTRDLIEKIRAVPATRACAASPAMRVLLDGLRNEPAQTR